jgi:hypothetical protein
VGDQRIFSKNLSVSSLITTYRMNPISAGSISLGSTFKARKKQAKNINLREEAS